MTRSAGVLILALAGACGDGQQSPTQPVTPPEENGAVVRGAVTDSLLGEGIPGVLVSLGPVITHTDSNGQFTVTAPRQKLQVLVDRYGYERFVDTLDVVSFRRISISLIRQAPAVTVCMVDASGIHAWIVDLQGRKTIDRRYATRVDIGGPGGSVQLTGGELHWQWLDDFTWRVDIPGVHAPRSDIHWRLVDDDGYQGIMTCDQVTDDLPADSGELM